MTKFGIPVTDGDLKYISLIKKTALKGQKHFYCHLLVIGSKYTKFGDDNTGQHTFGYRRSGGHCHFIL